MASRRQIYWLFHTRLINNLNERLSMHISYIIKFIIGAIVLAALITTGIAIYTHQSTPRELIDLSFYVTLGMGALGSLMLRGARLGDGPGRHQMTTSVTNSPNATRHAYYLDMMAGLSHGALIIVSAILWMVISAGIYQLIK